MLVIRRCLGPTETQKLIDKATTNIMVQGGHHSSVVSSAPTKLRPLI